VRVIKSSSYTPLIPTFSHKGEGAGTFVDTYALWEWEKAEWLSYFMHVLNGFWTL
jgi:hypothetical protein